LAFSKLIDDAKSGTAMNELEHRGSFQRDLDNLEKWADKKTHKIIAA